MKKLIGDAIEISVVVRDLESAITRYTELFGLEVHKRSESKEFGFKNAILPLGKGHIELMEPTDPTKPVGKFLAKKGEGVYLVGFDTADVAGGVKHLKAKGARVDDRRPDIAWVHPGETNGLFVELRKPEKY